MDAVIPARFSADRRSATWNPALSRATHVTVEVRRDTGEIVSRKSMNSGRVKVRETERIERILSSD